MARPSLCVFTLFWCYFISGSHGAIPLLCFSAMACAVVFIFYFKIFSLFYFLFFLSFVFSGPHPQHVEVPRLGVELEL